MGRVTVPFFISHQGCPHTCIFCDQRAISGASGILPGSAEIAEKVQAWRRSAPGRPLEAAFFGGTFTALPADTQEQLLAPLQPLLESGELTSVRISTRPDSIDPETVKRLAKQGVGTIEIGVQSMDDAILQAAGRGHDAASSESAIRCVKAHGLSAGAQLLPGLPGDTLRASLYSLERVIAAGADFVRLYPVVVLRGTELARQYESGRYRPLDLLQGVTLCKLLLLTAMKAGVDVIRIGLQAEEGLDANTVLAGCRHPALGQMVRSELYFDLLHQLVTALPGNDGISIRCHPSRLSDVAGHSKMNLGRLRKLRGPIRITPDTSLLREEVAMESMNHSIKGNIVTDLQINSNEV